MYTNFNKRKFEPMEIEEENNSDINNELKIINSKLEKIENKLEVNNNLIHYNKVCNGCGGLHIKGFRYKCLFCQNYNLCESCERNLNKNFSKIQHDTNHFFIKINNSANFDNIFPQYLEAVRNYKGQFI
tara:strand:+ start:34 stop:420 length:387 start_codon:yes stop_codon:yes gene_type:complete